MLLFTFALFVVPTSVLLALLLVLRAVRPEVGRVATAVCVGGLIALALVPLTKEAIDLRSRWYLALAVVLTIVLAIAYSRSRRFRSLLPWTALAGPALAALFLIVSPASAFVLPGHSIESERAKGKSNVVIVTFDEFPLAALLDDSGEINAKRFPGFGRLARRSTWYRSATTVAPWTHQAVPAMLSGSFPKLRTAPTSAEYPRNVFSVLRKTHHLRAMEIATYLCTAAECDSSPKDPFGMYKDATVVYLHIVMPTQLSAQLLPRLGARWANFDDGADATWREDDTDQGVRFERFNKGLTAASDGRPMVWFGHFLLPHLPLRYLPDGRTYEARTDAYGLTPDEFEWTGNRPLIEVSRQRFLLQLMYADRLIGQMIENLERRGLYDDTMLVVTADHGFVFQRGNRRGSPLTKARTPEILPVPLFIKYPGQAKSRVDIRPAQTVDIMPTIADVLHVGKSSNRPYDGTSLLGANKRKERTYVETGKRLHPPLEIDLRPASRGYLELFGTSQSNGDVFAWGRHRALLGTSLEPTRGRSRSPSATFLSGKIGPQDPKSRSVPALVQMEFDRRPGTDWFAVTINGIVAGLGRTYADGAHARGLAMLDPRYMTPRTNKIGVALLFGDGDYRFVGVR